MTIDDSLVYELIDETGRRERLFYSQADAWEYTGTTTRHLHDVRPIWLPVAHAVVDLDYDGGVRVHRLFANKEAADASARKLNEGRLEYLDPIEVEPWWLEQE